MDLEAVRAALRAQKPALLLEQPEGQWLDAKTVPYELRDPRAVEELAKDICGFANGGGGVLVLGIATRLVGDEEILDQIIPVDRASVDRDQIRKLIRARITPSPRGVSVEWSDDQQGARVLFIDVHAQEENCLFVVAAPVGKPGTPRTDTVAVPVREADGTHWLPRTEIQRLLSAGVAASGMPTAEALSQLLHDAVARSQGSGPAVLRIGQGLPDWEREMREAYEELAGASLGQSAGEAYRHGPAALQDLDHAVDGKPGWVLCVAPPRPPVVVAAPVWQAIVAAGRADIGGDPLAAIGYPVPPGASAGRGSVGGEGRRLARAAGGRQVGRRPPGACRDRWMAVAARRSLQPRPDPVRPQVDEPGTTAAAAVARPGDPSLDRRLRAGDHQGPAPAP
ncbi:helix-turn-helix domain-containing protein [Streptomyces sp. NPDC051636]|uniref:helix-turn-helix domain-containing protein n=1 Tax=Streptomyces sp. NPDC051636 TaxID=3365663 RepID=UPI0037AD48F9